MKKDTLIEVEWDDTFTTGAFSARDGTTIPIGCITKIRRLKHK